MCWGCSRVTGHDALGRWRLVMLLLYLVAVVCVARARADSLPSTQLCHGQLGKEACRTAGSRLAS